MIRSSKISRDTREGEAMVSPFFCTLHIILFYFLSAYVFLAAASCSPPQQQPVSVISVTDDLGRTVSLSAEPRRIVSLAPSHTETLFALGLDSSIVGVTNYCDFPERAGAKTRVGGMTSPDFETIVSLQPDLVVVTTAGNSRKDFETLLSLGLTVFVSNPQTLEDIYRSVRTLGTLCRHDEEADILVQKMQSIRDSLVRRSAAAPAKRVLLLVSVRPLVSAARGTFIDELLRMANLNNVIQNSATAYPILSREEVLSLRPDWIVGTSEIVHSRDDLLAVFPEWKALPALREGNVVSVDPSLISRPGPRIVLGLEALVNAIHR